MKKYILMLLILAFVLTACTGETTNQIVENSDEFEDIIEGELNSNINQKYLEYAAQVSCNMLTVTHENGDVMTAIQDAANFGKYGLTEEEVDEFGSLYQDDVDFAVAAYTRMREICLPTITAMGINEYTPN